MALRAVDLLAAIDAGCAPIILDVRSQIEFAQGHVPGAINVPFNAVTKHVDELPGSVEHEIVLYCGHGPRAYLAAIALRRHGRSRLTYLKGHWAGWLRARLRIER